MTKRLSSAIGYSLLFQMTRTVLFNSSYGDRPNISNIALVVTDGVPNRPQPEWESWTYENADLLKNISTVIAVAVASRFDMTYLRYISTDPDNIIFVDQFHDLLNAIDDVLDIICVTIPFGRLRQISASSVFLGHSVHFSGRPVVS